MMEENFLWIKIFKGFWGYFELMKVCILHFVRGFGFLFDGGFIFGLRGFYPREKAGDFFEL